MTDSTTLLDELDHIAAAGNAISFEFGWVANDYMSSVALEELDVPFRTVLSECLAELAERYKPYMVKNTLTDRVKVTRFFTRERVKSIPGSPSYNHVRACFVMGDWPDADEDATLQRVGWAVENGWPTPDTIRQQFGASNPDDNLIERAKQICARVANITDDEILRSLCRAVANYHCGEDGQWCKDDAVQPELLEAE
jgi:hypothetical protein